MKTQFFVLLGALSASLLAQPPHPDMAHRPGPGGPGGPGGFARDMKVVKGQPYAADLVNESVQVLGDGTKIVNKTAGSVFRDTDGRTRREEATADGKKSVTIFDPVAAISVSLNSTAKTAAKQSIHLPPADMGMRRQGMPGPGGVGRPNRGNGGQGQDAQNRAVEELGNQAMEGVAVQGRRTTRTIAAGTMGNDRDIKVIDEVWYSPDLQVVVQSRHSDPWTGDVTYKLSNIRRADQAHTLFEVPADYQVNESRGDFHRPAAAPVAK